MVQGRIRELREASKLTQGALGEKLNISQQAISRIERDVHCMSIEQLLILAAYFKVTTDYILGRELAGIKDSSKVAMSVSRDNIKFMKVLEDLNPDQKELVWVLADKMLEQKKQ